VSVQHDCVSNSRPPDPVSFQQRDYTFFNNTLSVAQCGFAIVFGLVIRLIHRYKGLQSAALAVRILLVLGVRRRPEPVRLTYTLSQRYGSRLLLHQESVHRRFSQFPSAHRSWRIDFGHDFIYWSSRFCSSSRYGYRYGSFEPDLLARKLNIDRHFGFSVEQTGSCSIGEAPGCYPQRDRIGHYLWFHLRSSSGRAAGSSQARYARVHKVKPVYNLTRKYAPSLLCSLS
jgi:hypothetical protein